MQLCTTLLFVEFSAVHFKAYKMRSYIGFCIQIKKLSYLSDDNLKNTTRNKICVYSHNYNSKTYRIQTKTTLGFIFILYFIQNSQLYYKWC